MTRKRCQQALTEQIAADYHGQPLSELGRKYGLHPLTIRKHLVTAGVYTSDKTEAVLAALHTVLEMKLPYGQILSELEKLLDGAGSRGRPMSAQAIYSYLPYDITASDTNAAARKRLQRERETAVGAIVDFDTLWEAILQFEGYPFYTAKGLLFRYQVKGGELFVNRKTKSITESSVKICYEKAIGMKGIVPGPKKLGVFGASYLYPMFVRFGVIAKMDALE